jgi:hypothetical protein
MGEWRHSSTTLDLDTRWKRVVSFTPPSHYLREKKPIYTLNTRLGSGMDAMEFRRILHFRESNPGRPACNSSLYRLSSPGF